MTYRLLADAVLLLHFGIVLFVVAGLAAIVVGGVRAWRIARCPRCLVALWSNYSGAGPRVHFVRVGTLDNPDLLPPDIHIFTASKQPWVVLPPGVPATAGYYDRKQHWPAESLARRDALLAKIAAAPPA